MKKYNIVTWWLDLPVKPLAYRIWKMVATPVVFILWVIFVAVYPDYYWHFSLYVVLPVAVVDFTWDGLQYYFYKKGKLKPSDKDNGAGCGEKQPTDDDGQKLN